MAGWEAAIIGAISERVAGLLAGNSRQIDDAADDGGKAAVLFNVALDFSRKTPRGKRSMKGWALLAALS